MSVLRLILVPGERGMRKAKNPQISKAISGNPWGIPGEVTHNIAVLHTPRCLFEMGWLSVVWEGLIKIYNLATKIIYS